MNFLKVHSVRTPDENGPPQQPYLLGVRTLCIAAIFALLILPSPARADCPAAPIGSADDMAISFLSANGVQAASSSQLPSSVKKGMLVYDSTANALKYCDGTNWQALVAAGSAANATANAGYLQISDGSTLTDSGTAAGQQLFWDQTNHRLGIGTAAPNMPLTISSDSEASATINGYAANTFATGVRLFSGRSGVASTTALQSGDKLGQISFGGFYSGKANNYFVSGDAKSAIVSYATENWTSASNNGTAIAFQTTTNGAGSPLERMRIDANGNIGIGTLTPAASALMDLTATDKGFLPPRMTTTQRNAIASPATGLTVYDTTLNSLYVYSGTAWTAVGANGSPVAFSVNRNGTAGNVASVGIYNLIDWTTAAYNTGSAFNLTSDRFVAPVAGKYIFDLSVFCPNAVNFCQAAIYKNGAVNAANFDYSGVQPMTTVSTIMDLAANDYIEAYVLPSNGSTTGAVGGGTTVTYFTGALLGGGSGGGGGSSTLAGLTDAAISSPTNGQCLTYDTATSKWKNAACGSGGALIYAEGATNGSTSVARASVVKVDLATKTDPSGLIDLTADTFTPTTAGYYLIVGRAELDYSGIGSDGQSFALYLYKNGALYSALFHLTNNNVDMGDDVFMNGSAIVYSTTSDVWDLRVYSADVNASGSAALKNGVMTIASLNGGGGGGSSQWTDVTGGLSYASGGAAVGTATLNASAILQADSTTKGFLPPRMTTAQRTAIASPAAGLTVYDTDVKTLYIYNGTAWTTAGSAVGGKSLTMTGSTTASSSTNFTPGTIKNTLLTTTPTSSQITIEESGTYLFSVAQNTCAGGTVGYASSQLVINGTAVSSANSLPNSCDSATVVWSQAMNAGDTAAGRCWDNNARTTTCTFTVTLVGGGSGGGSASATANSGYVQLSNGSTLTDSGTASGQQLYWDQTNHRLGIGTAMPAVSLHAQNAAATNYMMVESTAASSSTDFVMKNDARQWNLYVSGTTNQNGLIISDATAAKARLVIDTVGNVGIGTTTPKAQLQVTKNAGTSVAIESGGWGVLNFNTFWDTPNNRNSMIDTGPAGQIAFDPAAGALRFFTAPSAGAGATTASIERMTILNAGNVGIGTATPSATLEVRGTSPLTLSSASGALAMMFAPEDGTAAFSNTADERKMAFMLTGMADGDTSFGYKYSWRNANNSQRVDALILQKDGGMYLAPSAGNVGIGTTAPTSKLHVAGGIQLGNTADACPGTSNVQLGTLKYASNTLSICNSGGWAALSTSTGSSSSGAAGYVQLSDGLGGFTNSGATAGQQFFWDNTSKRLGIGTTAPAAGLHIKTETSGNLDGIIVENDVSPNPNADGPYLTLQYNEETSAPAENGDTMGGVRFRSAYASGTYAGYGASIKAVQDGTSTATSSPGALIFSTTPDGSTTLAERMRINGAGNVGIGGVTTINLGGALAGTGLYVRSGSAANHTSIVVGRTANDTVLAVAAAGGQYSSVATTGDAILRAETEDMIVRSINGSVRFTTGSPETERLTILPNGAVGIGTAAPASNLQVVGGVQLGNTADACPGTSNVQLGTLKYVSNTLSVCNSGGWTALSTSAGASSSGAAGYVQLSDGAGGFTSSGTTAGQQLFWDNTSKRLGVGTATPTYSVDVAGQLRLNPATTGSAVIELGNGATTDRFAYIDFVGDATYSDYGLRIIRYNTGANASSQIVHRGTGNLSLATAEAAAMTFGTSGSTRMTIAATGGVSMTSGLTVTGNVDASAQFLGNAADTAATPSFTWTGDTNAGIFRPAADVVGISTAGAERMRIDAAGSVGIGIAPSSATLHVEGTNVRFTSGTRGLHFRTDTTNSYINNMDNFVSNGSSGNGALYLTGQGGISLRYGSTGSTGTEALKIDTDGNIGVGIAPVTKFHIANGEFALGGGGASNTGTTAYMRMGLDTSYNQYILNNAYWTGSEYNVVSAGGYGGVSSRIKQASGTISLDTNSSAAGTNPVTFATRLQVLNNGNVGIGTTAPTQLLDVNGIAKANNLYLTAAAGNGIGFWNGAPSAYGIFMSNSASYQYGDVTDYYIASVVSSGAGRGFVWSYGTSPAMALNASTGNLTVKGAISAASFLYASDRRLKEDILPLKETLEKITELEPVSFKYKNDPAHAERLGLIAQEIESIYPQAVHTDARGYKSIDYPALVSPLIGAIKELKAANDNLEERLERLEAAAGR